MKVDVDDAILDNDQDVGVTVTLTDQGTFAFPEDSGHRVYVNHNTQFSVRKVRVHVFVILF